MEIDRLRDDDAPLVGADPPDVTEADVTAADVTEEPSGVAPDGDERATARAEYPAKVEAEYLDAARQHWRTTAHPAFEGEWAGYVEDHP